MGDNNNQRDTVLDFWRGVSILLVIFHHFFYFRFGIFKNFYAYGNPESFFEKIAWISNAGLIEFSERSGPLGVKIFFVISGYIITKLLISEESRNGTISIWNFYQRRAFRILPPYLFYLLFIFLFGIFNWTIFDNSELLYATGFMCNLGFAECSWNITHTWSLAIEEQFYLIWPALFLFVGSKYRVPFLTGSLILLLGLSALEIFVVNNWLNNSLSFALIAMGALYASSHAWRIFLERYGIFLSLAIVSLLLVFFATSWINEFSRQLYRNSFPLLIMAAIVSTYKARFLLKTVSFWAISQIGLVSYSLYLWQQVFLAPRENYPSSSFLLIPLFIVPIVIFSYVYIEKPAMNLIKRSVNKRKLLQNVEIASISQTSP